MSADEEAALQRPASLREFYLTFQWLALQGFGGVLAVVQRGLCERKRWLTREQFVDLLAVSQVLPGPNVCNLAVLIGDRFFGWRGAAVALAGLLAVPLVIVLALAALYTHYADVPAVAGALRGMAAVSAGLIAGTVLKLAGTLRTNPLGPGAVALLVGLTLIGVAVLRLPLVAVIAVLGTGGTLWAWRALKRAAAAGGGAR